MTGTATDLDLGDLSRRLGACLGRSIDEVERLPGGASGLTFRLRAGGDVAVARVAPPGLAPERNRDVLRQARLIRHLGSIDGITVPEVLGTDPGDPPDVPPLFVVAFAPGDSVEPLLDPGGALTQRRVDARSDGAATMLAALHQAPVPAEDAGTRCELAAEVSRWEAAFASTDADLRDSSEVVGAQLHSQLPAALDPSIVHGDWRLGNMLCLGDEVRAVIDWELWSVGDPRVDLAWFELFSDPQHPLRADPAGTLAAPGALRSAYTAARGDAIGEEGWFAALVRFKQAAAAALLVKNARKRPRPGFDPIPSIRSIPVLLSAALERLS